MAATTALRVGAGGAMCAAAGVGLYAQYDEGTSRSLVFWSNALPVYAQYRAVQFRNREMVGRCRLTSG